MNIFRALDILFKRRHNPTPFFDLSKAKHDEAVFLMKSQLSKLSVAQCKWHAGRHRLRIAVLQGQRPLPFPDGKYKPKPRIRHKLGLKWSRTDVLLSRGGVRRKNIPYYQ